MELKETFNQISELYDKIRPEYPEELFNDLAELANLNSNSKVLELGCGTGQATINLIKNDYEIIAVELGKNLANLTREKFKFYPKISIINSSFENYQLENKKFDLIFAATSFHWIDPLIKIKKSYQALKNKGVLAVVSTHHIRDNIEEKNNQFFIDVQTCYQKWLNIDSQFYLPKASEIKCDDSEYKKDGYFNNITFNHYQYQKKYSAKEYCELLTSYSGTQLMSEENRNGLLNCIFELINQKYNGYITKSYLNQLMVAYKS